jgi:signal transduction histidine kinase
MNAIAWVKRVLATERTDDPAAPETRAITAKRYGAAVLLTAFAMITSRWVSDRMETPSFLPFAATVALAAWYGGRGPSVLASVLSVLVIDYDFLPPLGALELNHSEQLVHSAVFLVVALTLSSTTESLRAARRDAQLRAAELEAVNKQLELQIEEVQTLSEELQESNDYLQTSRDEAERLAARATRLRDVTAALSEAQTTADVTAVVLGQGREMMQAARAILTRVEGSRLAILGAVGYDPSLVETLTVDEDAPLPEALRRRVPVWITSVDDFRERFPRAFTRFGFPSDTRSHAAIPLIHRGELVAGLSMSFVAATAFGATDQAFTLLFAQSAADALFRARRFDEEQNSRRAAETLARTREEVLGVVAHDLRNPLNLIGSSAELLLELNPDPARRQQLLGVTRRAVTQMNRLIGDLLDTVRLQAGRLALDLDNVPVATIVQQADETFRPLAEEKQIKLEVDAAPADLRVRADSGRTMQVIGNLLGNALKFTRPGGNVALHVAPDGDGVVFRVADNGPGLAPEAVQHVFDRFWQARSTDHRGVGLGLAIAKGIVEAHHGRIWVDSEVGVGTTFSFTLPTAPPADSVSRAD